MMDSITQAALSLAQSAGVWGYWFALLAALAETAFLLGLLVPGSALLLLMGMLAGQGVFDLGDLLFFAIAGGQPELLSGASIWAKLVASGPLVSESRAHGKS